MQVKGVSKFPNVVFADIKSDRLKELHKLLFGVLPSSQPQFEGKNYIPHASMAILKNPSKSYFEDNELFGEFEVKEIQLVIWDKQNWDKPDIYYKFSLK